ncbi:MAG: SusE domain-containing protein [Paludibacter sp.]
MKTKKIIFFTIGTILLLCACNNDLKVMIDPDKIVHSEWNVKNNSIFPNHGDTLILNKADASLVFDTISWSPTDFGYNAIITYSIQMAVMKDDSTYSEFKTVATTNKTTYPLIVNDINTFILNAGAIKRRQTNVSLRISASISSVYPTIYSNEQKITATTYSTDPDKLYFVGDYSDNKTDSAEYIFSPNWDQTYNGYAYLPKSTTGIWVVEEINPGVRWGITTSTAQGSTLTLVKESDGGQPIKPGAFGVGNIEASFVDSAYYRVSVTMKETSTTKTIQVWRFYSKFFVPGQRNMNYIWWGNNFSGQDPDVPAWNVGTSNDPIVWGTGALLTYYPKERVWKSDVVYVPKYQTAAGAPPQPETTGLFQFKFRANWTGKHNPNGSSTTSWGNAANLGGGSSDMVNDSGVQTGRISGTGNINFNGLPGNYRFMVYLNSYPLQYQLIPAN